MEYFLENIARSIHSEFGNTLNRHSLVFPNRRAGLYFMKYLAARIQKPVWTPSVLTVNELFNTFSEMQVAGNEILLFELYKLYRKMKKSPESFDDFYFWGEMLLNDFDDVDKYLVNARKLFSNVLDIKNIDNEFGGLTGDQIRIVSKFWTNFNPASPTKEKSEFINIWSILDDLYNRFRGALKERNLAYEGMIFRELAESGDEIFQGIRWDMVHFIGFNAINECEKVVMKRLQNAGKARFYWDYDNSYTGEGKINSAGFFMRENLKLFGNDMPADWNYDTMLTNAGSPRKYRVIETSSDLAQVKLISRLLNDLPDLTEATARHTAIVLSDENLLMPVLTSLPGNIGDFNITMGYPLKQTLVYTLIKNLMDLQRNALLTGDAVRFNGGDIIRILKHPLLERFFTDEADHIINEITSGNLIRVSSDRFKSSPLLSRLFIRPADSCSLSEYFKDILSLVTTGGESSTAGPGDDNASLKIRNEFIYRTILSINRLEALTVNGEVCLSAETYMRVLDRMLRVLSVPFSGEPLSGVQIMGILETRALDFKNLIMLSVNEGTLPAVSSGSSFIPFSLREAFGLPSVNHRESVYAYHFYRLLHRAENVTFLYNSNSEGLNSGEMSRFLVQMKYDPLLKPEFLDLSFEIKTHGSTGERLERSEEHLRQLNSRFLDRDNKRILSPSAINMWLNCRMKFYYRYVNGLMEREAVTKDIDPAMLGNILHDIMKNLFGEHLNQVVTGSVVEAIIGNRSLLQGVIMRAINDKFNKGTDNPVDGNVLIITEVLRAYAMKILRADRLLAPFRILNLEDLFSFLLVAGPDSANSEVLTGGTVDRIDIVEGVTRIVDYKTGMVSDSINSIDDLFSPGRKKESDGWLQTLLYCEAYMTANPGITVRPSIYKIRKLSGSPLNDKLRIKTGSRSDVEINDYLEVRDQFMENLKSVISAIFSSDEPFIMTSDIRGKCTYCPYRALCTR
jgi:CRISPR/Cas system-associated exonuclease Cas4 (RecB family)